MKTLPLIPTEGAPAATAAKAYSIWTSFPEGLKVVKEKLYLSVAMMYLCLPTISDVQLQVREKRVYGFCCWFTTRTVSVVQSAISRGGHSCLCRILGSGDRMSGTDMDMTEVTPLQLMLSSWTGALATSIIGKFWCIRWRIIPHVLLSQ